MQHILAAIDLGSNSFHMIVGKNESGQIIVLDRIREMIRLASGLDEKNNISPEFMNKAFDCLARFGERIRHLDADVVRIVGTNTLRKAHNSNRFMSRGEKILGHPIEIISGIEEARLIYSGVAHNVASDNGQRLVVDIGGGSTEIIIGERYKPIRMESLYMGCVSMTKYFFSSGEITRKKILKAHMHAMRELEPSIYTYKNLGWQDAIGSSGTVRAIEKIAIEQGWSSHGITRDALDKILDHLLDAGHIDKVSLKGIKAERLPVITGGTIVLNAIFDAFDIENMVVSNGALREGILYDLIGRDKKKNTRSETVEKFAKRFVIDRAHANRVEKTAQHLFGQVKKSWFKNRGDAKKTLQWAAILHEAGLSIAHNHFHKHGAYLTGHADLLGFSRQGQQLLSLIIQQQRRSLNMELFNEFESDNNQVGERLTILLRLAILLNRSRIEEESNIPAITVNNKQINLSFDQDWLSAHPLTKSDLEAEVGYLDKAGYRFLFT
ncbi:MAG TPA: exopolyphosphatase [Gammaproteobacteria bacterium]|nr:exopolyphosphatase [Gammaproteobacteria bacterium]